jgi:hypothetical protein
MKNSLLKGLMVFLTMLCTSLTYSQDVSGTVSDASGPLPGASVLVKGTTKGAQTDFDGKFTIKNVGSNAVLVFSYIGLKTQEVNVAGRSNVNVTLKEDSAELKEVVVIGYGSVKKKDATGAVDQLSSKSFDNVGAPNPADLLRGKVAGVQVTQSSGEPGAAASIRIRGNSSIRSGNGPLIVVDGVPLDGGDVSAGSTTVTFRESDGDPRLVENNIYAMFAVTGAASGSEITLSEQDELGGLGNVTFNFTTALTPIVDESLVFAAFIPFDFNLSTALTGSGYSLTPSSAMTKRVDIGYRDGSSDGQSLMIATTEYSGRTQITSRSVTISETITSGIGSIIFLVNAPQSATATNAVFQTSPVTFATLTGSTQNATSDFTEISPNFLIQSGRGTTPTQWSNESKPSTDWSNET